MTKENGFCALHNIKCGEWKSTEESVKNLEKEKLSIRMFRLFLGIAIIAVEFVNVTAYRANQETLAVIESHIEVSNQALSRISHITTETAVNQHTVMEELKLKYQKLPHYK